MRVSTGSLDHGHDVCSAQAAGNGRKAGLSLFMCVIDLQKAYDTVVRTLLWQIVTRSGVSLQIIAVIQKFHYGMRACVRPDDGVCSDWSRTKARMLAIPAFVQHSLRSRAGRCPPKIHREYGHRRQAVASDETADVDRNGAGYGLRSSCRVGYAVRGSRLHSFVFTAAAW